MIPFPFQTGGLGLVAQPISSPSTDPFFANVISLLHFDGSDASTTFTDQIGTTTWTATSGAELDTAQAKFGPSSALFPAGVNSNFGRINSNTDASFAFGTGDFTIEGWLYINSGKAGFRILFDTRPAATNGAYPTIYVNSTTIVYFTNSGAQITSGGVVNLTGLWQHFAVSRVSGSTRLFLAGTQVGSTYSDSTNYLNQRFRYGNTSTSDITDNLFGGWLDDCRITKGVGRYTSNFTPPAAPFPNS